jgi:hypothetical protein
MLTKKQRKRQPQSKQNSPVWLSSDPRAFASKAEEVELRLEHSYKNRSYKEKRNMHN